MGAVSITGGGYANAGEPGDAIRLLGIAWEIVDYGRIHRGSILDTQERGSILGFPLDTQKDGSEPYPRNSSHAGCVIYL